MDTKNDNNYKKSITLNASSSEIFTALNEGLDSWWGKISNAQFKPDGMFTIQFANGYWWSFKIIEYTPNTELIWKCTAGEPDFNKEWIGHTLHWNLIEKDGKTQLDFHQIGLTPDIHCYDSCSTTWDLFISDALKNYVEQIGTDSQTI